MVENISLSREDIRAAKSPRESVEQCELVPPNSP